MQNILESLEEDTSKTIEEPDEGNTPDNPDSNPEHLDELSSIEEEESQSQETKATQMVAESDDCQKMDANSATEDTIIPADNAAPEMPETDTVFTPIEEVGCLFLTS